MPDGHDLHSAAAKISEIFNPQPAQREPAQQAARQPQPAGNDPLRETPDVELGEDLQDPGEEPAGEGNPAPADEGEAEPPVTAKKAGEPEQEQQQAASEYDASEVELEPAQFAALIGLDEQDIDVSDDGAISIRAKVDGDVQRVSLSDLRDGYQLAKTSQQRLQKLAEDRKTLDNERNQALQELAQQHQQVAQVLQTIEHAYMTDFGKVDWNNLRSDDPTEYNLRRTDFEDRRRALDGLKANVAQGQQLLGQQLTQQVRQKQIEGARQLDELFSGPEYRNAPAWNDQEKDRLGKWIVSHGFTPEQIATVTEPRLFQWARDAMLWRDQQKQAQKTVKKVVRLPRISKPSTPQKAQAVKKTRIAQAKKRQRDSGGDLASTEAYIKALFEQQT